MGSCSDLESLHFFEPIGILKLIRILVLMLSQGEKKAKEPNQPQEPLSAIKVIREWIRGFGKITHLPHINRHLTTLSDNTRRVISHHPLFEVREDLRGSNTAKSLGSFVSDHVRLLRVP